MASPLDGFALPLPSLGGLLGYLLIAHWTVLILLTDWLNGRLSGGRGILSFFLNNRDSTHSSSSETPVSRPFLPTSSLNFRLSPFTSQSQNGSPFSSCQIPIVRDVLKSQNLTMADLMARNETVRKIFLPVVGVQNQHY